MNYITCDGGTKFQRELAVRIVEFCIWELMPRHRTLDLDIQLKPTIFEQHSEALCYPTGEDYRPRDFCLEIDSRIWRRNSKRWKRRGARDDFITTVAHEMVHVYQWVSGNLRDRLSNSPSREGYRQYWKGKDYTNIAYKKLPYEKEAYRMQERLLKKFKKWEDLP